MNITNPIVNKRWIRVAAFSGLWACIVYPVVTNVAMTLILQLILGASFGPALAFASIGLYKILKLNKDSVSVQAAMISNIIAGAMVTAMMIVQMSVRYSSGADKAEELIVKRIWDLVLGLDVTFDVFIGLGTILFGVAMLKHPRFGKFVGITGIIIGAVFTIGFNFYTFPDPPGEVGLIDTGPVTGMWYLLVIIYVFRSLKWFNRQIDSNKQV